MRTILLIVDNSIAPQFILNIHNFVVTAQLWAHPLNNVWFFKSTLGVDQIRAATAGILGVNNSGIIVLDVTGRGWATNNINQQVTAWMKSSL